ncbi:hypothetical protein SAMN05444280_10461 [Tangfeifania diversioriginum]|uniref:TIGR01777 family protein n=1 Tax=Tangfeifania diversioriginum TaxID=1168035 RepID=A0A1M6CRB6_9BACT|nr:TIGR01777 family oxidoreductase [Tangfeifania diversioriginum]SHI63423.1 hypothetical protein SAMN05444280_10461 [Tangfeifania diversioriginum]
MQIKMTGASGYLGEVIKKELIEKRHQVLPISRSFLYGSTDELAAQLKGTQVLINLAGAPILQRWTSHNKQVIYESRVQTTSKLVKAIQKMNEDQRPQKVISASAVGIYAVNGSHDEKSTDFDNGFVGTVVKDWENAWKDLPGNVELTIFRLGVVLGKEAQTIKKLWLPFKLGLGGKIGNGKQPFPFVHEKDVARAFTWALDQSGRDGIYNLAAPQKITNKGFTKAMAGALKRPAIIPVPEFALRVVYGKAATLLTESPEVIPRELEKQNFEFSYPDIESTLKEITG